MKDLLQLLRTHWKPVLLVLIVLLLLPAVVAALMAAEDEQAPSTVPAEPTAVESPALPETEEPSPPPVEAAGVTRPFAEYREMIERPLFSSTRRPPVLRDAPQENLDGQQLREAWRLSGIALEQGRQLASFSERQGEGRLLLEIGMVLADEWRLEQIGSDHVLLSNGASEVRMPLREPVVRDDQGEPGAEPVKRKKRKQAQASNGSATPTDNTTPPKDTPAAAVPAP
ncbi:hypothetical protein [Pseudomonas zhanjiangensis]|uniref:General secretion pathway protein N n=1 Tax=Pseudomonas zhanjiangensis TaxID=3239015 RepID=A0ABV3YNR6_9PSED